MAADNRDVTMAQAESVLNQVQGICGWFTGVLSPGGRPLVPASSFFAGLLAALSFFHLAVSSLDFALALVPHHLAISPTAYCPIPFLWSAASGQFFESSWPKAAGMALLLLFLTRKLERLWAFQSIFALVVFAAFASGFAVFLTVLVIVFSTERETLFFAPLRGSCGVAVTLAVALRHAYPLEPIPPFPRKVGLRFQHLAFLLVLSFSVAGLLLPWSSLEWLFAPYSLFFGWFYLRYLMWFPYAEAHGDHSQDFDFELLFPRPLRAPVACVGFMTYSLWRRVAPRFLTLREAGRPFSSEGLRSRPTGDVDCTGPGSKGYTERRAKAMALLNENINSLLAPEADRGQLTGFGRAFKVTDVEAAVIKDV